MQRVLTCVVLFAGAAVFAFGAFRQTPNRTLLLLELTGYSLVSMLQCLALFHTRPHTWSYQKLKTQNPLTL